LGFSYRVWKNSLQKRRTRPPLIKPAAANLMPQLAQNPPTTTTKKSNYRTKPSSGPASAEWTPKIKNEPWAESTFHSPPVPLRPGFSHQPLSAEVHQQFGVPQEITIKTLFFFFFPRGLKPPRLHGSRPVEHEKSGLTKRPFDAAGGDDKGPSSATTAQQVFFFSVITSRPDPGAVCFNEIFKVRSEKVRRKTPVTASNWYLGEQGTRFRPIESQLGWTCPLNRLSGL